MLYSFYLSSTQKKESYFACAPITKAVANQTNLLLNAFGVDSKIEQNSNEVSMNLFIDNNIVARVIEGCNAVSIIILFISFVVAFSAGFKSTFLYVLFGSALIYVVNVARIGIIAVAIYKLPQYEHWLHDYIFPAIIYGLTFLLWFVWIRKFSKLKNE